MQKNVFQRLYTGWEQDVHAADECVLQLLGRTRCSLYIFFTESLINKMHQQLAESFTAPPTSAQAQN